MATFSVNQNRQFYVAKELATTAATLADKGVAVITSKDDKQLYFLNKGAGGIVRSDLIDVDKITNCKYTTASELRTLPCASYMDVSGVTAENIIPGQDYLVRIFIRQYLGASDIYPEVKFAVVHASQEMKTDTKKFFAALIKALYRSQKNEEYPLYKVGYSTTANAAPSTWTIYEGGDLALTEAPKVIGVYAAEQPWRLGLKKETRAEFEMFISPVTKSGEDYIWAEVKNQAQLTDTKAATYAIKNGRKMADLEYFCMGERGDIYRGINWPHNIETEYCIDPSKEYHTLDIHYSYVGSGVSSQKSEKDITIAILSDVTAANIKNFLQVISDLGVTVNGMPTDGNTATVDTKE